MGFSDGLEHGSGAWSGVGVSRESLEWISRLCSRVSDQGEVKNHWKLELVKLCLSDIVKKLKKMF